ncbi:RNA polymerase ECF-type sigma factor [Pedobacter sp. BAL39]|uniref:RNA polymerase sigma factor n=1 Tax=Pedobacter sp. BAL39 TaxID=391596 RepID=UPI00015594E0|nr:RNA polymerase sigma-70 factor [Pedobacter sp. BAL39]EDM38002.1 RNA polymerase ECF-type sigma factor [Pedobacter sp. BAL39]
MGRTIHKLINETELFASLAGGDEKAFDVIYRHFSKRLFPYVQKLVKTPELTEELIQDIFVQLWINRSTFVNVQHPTSYLFSIANRQALKYLKKVANDARILKSITDHAETSSNDTEEQIILRESKEAIDLAVAQLPDQRRLIWELRRNEGLSHQQIAERLNISKNTVKNQMVHALKHVRNFLDKRSGLLTGLIIILLDSRRL